MRLKMKKAQVVSATYAVTKKPSEPFCERNQRRLASDTNATGSEFQCLLKVEDCCHA